MNHIPEEPVINPPSHLRTYVQEAMAGLRQQSMDLLVEELLIAFSTESYQLSEFIDALSNYAASQTGWEEVVKHLELASHSLVKIRREGGDFPR